MAKHKRSGGFRRKGKRPAPTRAQIAKGALSSLAIALPLGTIGAFGLSAVDGYVNASGKGWAPPVIGWRGAAGLALLIGGALAKSPVFAATGGVLFGSAIPQATRAIGKAVALGGGSPDLAAALASAGEPVNALPYYTDEDLIDPDYIAGDEDEAIEGEPMEEALY